MSLKGRFKGIQRTHVWVKRAHAVSPSWGSNLTNIFSQVASVLKPFSSLPSWWKAVWFQFQWVCISQIPWFTLSGVSHCLKPSPIHICLNAFQQRGLFFSLPWFVFLHSIALWPYMLYFNLFAKCLPLQEYKLHEDRGFIFSWYALSPALEKAQCKAGFQ